MKKLIHVLTALSLLYACSSGINTAEHTLSFLNETFPSETFTVGEVGPIEPICTPFEDIISCKYTVARAMCMQELDNAPSFWDSVKWIAEVLQDMPAYSRAHPDECTRKGFVAQVTRKGRTIPVTFVLNEDEQSIGHCSISLELDNKQLTYEIARVIAGR